MIEYNVRVFENVTQWRLNGQLHREGAPAVEYSNGSQAYYKHGERHRVGGPARIKFDGSREWWLDGVQYSEEEYSKKLNQLLDESPEELPGWYEEDVDFDLRDNEW